MVIRNAINSGQIPGPRYLAASQEITVLGALVAIASVVLAFAILPAAGVVLLVSLLLAATVVPWITSSSAAEAERLSAPARAASRTSARTVQPSRLRRCTT